MAVVVRTKNRPLLLNRALASVLSQTFGAFVVCVVNDAGDREPVERLVAAAAEAGRGRLHIVHNEVSRGREAAMNVGIHATASDYVVIHDDDDTWAPTFLEQTVGHLENADAQGVATRAEVVYERIVGDQVITESRELLATDKNAITLLDTIVRNYTPTNSLLYRRRVHETVGDYDESLPVLADWNFMLQLLSSYEVDFIDGEPLAFWHRRPASTGDEGNSVYAVSDDHADWDTVIRDRYLRSDLARQNGLGYLLQINEVLDRDRKYAQDRGAHVAGKLNELATSNAESHRSIHQQLVELNRNTVGQSNRMVAQYERLGDRVAELEQLVYSQTPRGRLHSYRRLAAARLRRFRDRRS